MCVCAVTRTSIRLDKEDAMGEKEEIKNMQLFLRVSGDESPRLTMLPVGKSYPADMVLLPGCTVCAKEEYDEQDAWDGCGKVANMCREGFKISDSKADLYHRLEDAFAILEDLMVLMADEEEIGCLSIHALASKARENVVKAAQCVDLHLEPAEPAREV